MSLFRVCAQLTLQTGHQPLVRVVRHQTHQLHPPLDLCVRTEVTKCYKIRTNKNRPTVSRARRTDLKQEGGNSCEWQFHLLTLTFSCWTETTQVSATNQTHTSGTSAHPSLNFPSCSCYWKMMEAVCLAPLCSVQCYNRQHWQPDGRTHGR